MVGNFIIDFAFLYKTWGHIIKCKLLYFANYLSKNYKFKKAITEICGETGLQNMNKKQSETGKKSLPITIYPPKKLMDRKNEIKKNGKR